MDEVEAKPLKYKIKFIKDRYVLWGIAIWEKSAYVNIYNLCYCVKKFKFKFIVVEDIYKYIYIYIYIFIFY